MDQRLMDQRLQRYVIPATVVLMSAILTVWLSASPQQVRSILETFNTKESALTFIVAVGVTTYGLGYVAHVLFLVLMFLSPRERLVDPTRLLQAFGVAPNGKRKPTSRQLEALLDEFHFRFHSTAPPNLLDHATRRNTGWYIANACGIGALLGLKQARILSV